MIELIDGKERLERNIETLKHTSSKFDRKPIHCNM
jgi:hypothetical protein